MRRDLLNKDNGGGSSLAGMQGPGPDSLGRTAWAAAMPPPHRHTYLFIGTTRYHPHIASKRIAYFTPASRIIRRFRFFSLYCVVYCTNLRIFLAPLCPELFLF